MTLRRLVFAVTLMLVFEPLTAAAEDIPDYYRFYTERSICSELPLKAKCDECLDCLDKCTDEWCRRACYVNKLCVPGADESCGGGIIKHQLCGDSHNGKVCTSVDFPGSLFPPWFTDKEGQQVAIVSSPGASPEQAKKERDEQLNSIPVYVSDDGPRTMHDPYRIVEDSVYRGGTFICKNGAPEPVLCAKRYSIDEQVKQGDLCRNSARRLAAGEKEDNCATFNHRPNDFVGRSLLDAIGRSEVSHVTESDLGAWMRNDPFDPTGDRHDIFAFMAGLQEGDQSDRVDIYDTAFSFVQDTLEPQFLGKDDPVFGDYSIWEWEGEANKWRLEGAHAVIFVDATINGEDVVFDILDPNRPSAISTLECKNDHGGLACSNYYKGLLIRISGFDTGLTTRLRDVRQAYKKSPTRRPDGDLLSSTPAERVKSFASQLSSTSSNFATLYSSAGNCLGWSSAVLHFAYLANFVGDPKELFPTDTCASEVLGEQQSAICSSNQSCCNISNTITFPDGGQEGIGAVQCAWQNESTEVTKDLLRYWLGITRIQDCHSTYRTRIIIDDPTIPRSDNDDLWVFAKAEISTYACTAEAVAEHNAKLQASGGTSARASTKTSSASAALSSSPQTYEPLSAGDKCSYRILNNGVYSGNRLYFKNNYIYVEHDRKPTADQFERLNNITGYSTAQKNFTRASISDAVFTPTKVAWYWQGTEAQPQRIFIDDLGAFAVGYFKTALQAQGVDVEATCKTNGVPAKFQSFLNSAPVFRPCGQTNYGDSNNDGKLDEADLKLLLAALGKPARSGFLSLIDLNRNKLIDFTDLALETEAVAYPVSVRNLYPENCSRDASNRANMSSFANLTNAYTGTNVFTPAIVIPDLQPTEGDRACDGFEAFQDPKPSDCVRLNPPVYVKVTPGAGSTSVSVTSEQFGQTFSGSEPQTFGLNKGQTLTLTATAPARITTNFDDYLVTARTLSFSGASCSPASQSCALAGGTMTCPQMTLTCRIPLTGDLNVTPRITEATRTNVRSIAITAPKGGEIFAPGSMTTLNWTSLNVQYVTITYSKLRPDGSVESSGWVTPADATGKHGFENKGTFVWKIPPDLAAGNYITQVFRFDPNGPGNGAVFPIANSNQFKVAMPSITLTAPKAAESYFAGSKINISWTSEAVDKVIIVYAKVRADGSVESTGWITPIDPTDPDKRHGMANSGSYLWTTPATLAPGSYIVQVFRFDPAGPGTGAVPPLANSAPFAIRQYVEPKLTLTAPGAGVSIQAGAALPIAWTSQGLDRVIITYSQLSSTGSAIATGYVTPADPDPTNKNSIANTGSYTWVLSRNLPVGQYIVQVFNFDRSAAGSGATFPIVNSSNFSVTAAAPWLELTSPTAATTVKAGQTVNITWRSSPLANVVISFRWLVIQGNNRYTSEPYCIVNSSKCSFPNTNNYSWTIPTSMPSGTYVISVSGYDAAAPGLGETAPGTMTQIYVIN